MPVSTVRNWLKAKGLDDFNEHYPHVHLTQPEADACLAWTFPPIHAEPRFHSNWGGIECVCGEEAVEFDDRVWHCSYCRTNWTLTVVTVDHTTTQVAPDAPDREEG
jgi:hypothetical protein